MKWGNSVENREWIKFKLHHSSWFRIFPFSISLIYHSLPYFCIYPECTFIYIDANYRVAIWKKYLVMVCDIVIRFFYKSTQQWYLLPPIYIKNLSTIFLIHTWHLILGWSMYHFFSFKFYGHHLWQQCLDFRESVVKRLAWNCFILWYRLDKIDFLAYPWLPSKLWWGGIIAVTVNIVPSPYWAIHYYILPIFLARLLYLGVKINYLVYGALKRINTCNVLQRSLLFSLKFSASFFKTIWLKIFL